MPNNEPETKPTPPEGGIDGIEQREDELEAGLFEMEGIADDIWEQLSRLERRIERLEAPEAQRAELPRASGPE